MLLRSTTELSPIYEKEISDLGMPVYSETSTEYLNSVEIQLIMSCLKIIDNPMQDIINCISDRKSTRLNSSH